ncbi:MAG: DUF5658 family protein [Dehalococcoidales bacterium]|nr:DUF5658 family protein [Dehalococcoidales bacterium]
MIKLFSPGGKRKMLWLLGILVGFVILDGVITEILLAQNLARESNPFLQPLVGDIGFMLLKIVGSLLCAFILWDIYRRFPKVATIATWCFVAVYGLIVLWNSSLFLLA